MEVKWFRNEKGYGFIEYKANGEITIYFYDFETNEERKTIIRKEVS